MNQSYVGAMRLRTDMAVRKPLNLSSTVLSLQNIERARQAAGRFIVLADCLNGWDMFCFGTSDMMKLYAREYDPLCDTVNKGKEGKGLVPLPCKPIESPVCMCVGIFKLPVEALRAVWCHRIDNLGVASRV